MSRYLASFPMASSMSWKKTNHQKNQQKATSDSTATARRSVADWKNSSGPKLDRQPRRSVAERNSGGPKLDGQPRRSAERKPKTSLFGTDSLQRSALGIHDHAQNRPTGWFVLRSVICAASRRRAARSSIELEDANRACQPHQRALCDPGIQAQ